MLLAAHSYHFVGSKEPKCLYLFKTKAFKQSRWVPRARTLHGRTSKFIFIIIPYIKLKKLYILFLSVD